MRIGERLRRWRAAIALIVGGLAALLVAMLVPGAGTRTTSPAWRLCGGPTECRPVDISTLGLTEPISTLQTLYVGGRRPGLPLAAHVTAMASAELYWNGVLIGRNGRVGANRTLETPGRFDAVLPVPPDLVRPGANIVTVRLSAHHLWAPVARPIHWLSIGPYDRAADRIFVHYLPTLIVIGLLLVAFATNLSLWLVRGGTGMTMFALLAGTIMLQAAVETGKLVLVYPYPWQLARLVALAGLATLAGLLVTAIALLWVREWRARAIIFLIVALGMGGAWLLLPWWDAKTLWAFRIGMVGALVAAAMGAARGVPNAGAAAIGAIVALALSGIPAFLDFGYYLVFAGLFACEILLSIRSLLLAERVEIAAPPSREGTDLIVIPNGGSQQHVAMSDILYVRADDDYSIIHLTSGRQLLATMNLAALLRLAPERLLRVHRSHAINPEKIEVLHRTGKFARTVELAGNVRLPIGRTYWKPAAGRLTPNRVG